MGAGWRNPAEGDWSALLHAQVDELRGQRDAMQAALATIAARLEALTKACPVYELEDLLGLADLAERAALGVDDDGG